MYFTIMDDDRAFGETLKNKLESEYHAVVDVYHGMIDLDQIKHVPDILFLDVIFENGTGVDYAKKYKEKFDSQIVFVSSKSSLIFKTQGLKALCFIRKSHLDNDFKVFKQLYDEECKNEMKLIFELNKGMNKNQMAYITLMSDDIIYAECYAHELIIHTHEHEYAVKMTLKKFMEQVKQAHCFIQIHRSYAINMKYIYRIDKNHINMVNEESKNELEIGRKYKKEVNEAFRNYLMDKF